MYHFRLFNSFIIFILLAVACVPQSVEPIPLTRPPETNLLSTLTLTPDNLTIEVDVITPPALLTPEAYPPPTSEPTSNYPQMTSPTAVPIQIHPSIQPITSLDILPTLPHDLLFLDSGRLLMWHQDGQLETIAGRSNMGQAVILQTVSTRLGPEGVQMDGSVHRFSVSADGRFLTYLQWYNNSSSQIIWLDLLTRESQILVEVDISLPENQISLPSLEMSPDGQWVAYMISIPDQSAGKPAGYASMNMPSPQSYMSEGNIFLVPVVTPSSSVEISRCQSQSTVFFNVACGNSLYWSPDSQILYWHDAEGIWDYKTVTSQSQLIVQNQLAPPDHGTGGPIYRLQNIAPSGHHLLAWASGYEGGKQVVVEVATGAVIDVPDSSEYVNPGPRLAWLNDDRLLAVRGSGSFSSRPDPLLEIWRVDWNSNQFILDMTIPLTVEGSSLPREPYQLSDGRLAFAIYNNSGADTQSRGIYTADAQTLSYQKLNSLPPYENYYSTFITWEANGSGAIFQDSEVRYLLYIPTDGSVIYDLLSVFSENACCFTWLP